MGRLYAQGIRYYPQLVNEFEKDTHLMDIRDEFGPLGEAVFFRIRNWVFAEGYYLKIPLEQLCKNLRRSIGSKWVGSLDKISDIILYMAYIGFLDKNLMQEGVITSVDFQTIYCSLVERRKGIHIEEYWLLESKPLLNDDINKVNASNNQDNVNKKAVNVDKRKGKKIKEIDKSDRIDKGIFLDSFNLLTRILIKNGLVDLDDLDLMEYDTFLDEELQQKDMKELLTVVNYVIKHMLRNLDNIDNKIAYFITSVRAGLIVIKKPVANYESFIKKVFEQCEVIKDD